MSQTTATALPKHHYATMRSGRNSDTWIIVARTWSRDDAQKTALMIDRLGARSRIIRCLTADCDADTITGARGRW